MKDLSESISNSTLYIDNSYTDFRPKINKISAMISNNKLKIPQNKIIYEDIRPPTKCENPIINDKKFVSFWYKKMKILN